MRSALVLVAFASLSYASTPLARDVSAKLYTACKNPGHVALTFDDGPWTNNKKISDMVSNAGGNCTFFMRDCIYNSYNSTNYTAVIRYAIAAGHQIASHSWSHKDLTTCDNVTMGQELDWMNTALKKVAGVVPAVIRPPYGAYNDDVLKACGARNMSVVTWDSDSEDSWANANASNSKAAYDRQIRASQGSMLILNHETVGKCNEVLAYALEALISYGFQLVTVAKCLDIAPYLWVGQPEKTEPLLQYTWVCNNSGATS
ncbi:carbohydrate esterase family 4 protein [Mycena olivaceomarginata]|nr:carbohydrate esterase family 4 protein [Mycena olivaceomarginata]